MYVVGDSNTVLSYTYTSSSQTFSIETATGPVAGTNLLIVAVSSSNMFVTADGDGVYFAPIRTSLSLEISGITSTHSTSKPIAASTL